LLLATAITIGVEWLGVLGLGQSHAETAVPYPEQAWATPIQIEEVPTLPLPPDVEAPKLLNPKIKLGGGRPGGTGKRRRISTTRNPKPSPPTLIPDAPSRPKVIAAPPGPTTSVPLTNLDPPEEATEELLDDGEYAEAGDVDSDAPPGEGFPDGDPDGTITDPLAAHAIRLYRWRVQAWFAERFRLSGTGLPQASLAKLRAVAVVSVGADRRVSGSKLSSSGNAVFDSAVRRVLDSVQGLEIPPPPQHYPGILRGQVNITFVCGENTCD
jgi:hypothetical protein